MSATRKTVDIVFGILIVALTSGCISYDGDAEDVTFTSADGTVLAGTFVLPDKVETPVPAVVLLHGAEPATRSMAYKMHANVFLERGMAVLLFDKRGAGESGGDHSSKTFEQLISDALAAVQFVRERNEVSPSRIGVVGVSQSGWITPEVAERSGDLAFVINKVSPCSAWFETVAWEMYNDLMTDGVAKESAREQAEIQRQIRAYYIFDNAEVREELEDVLARWATREDSQLPERLEPVSQSYIDMIGYDPVPFIKRATTPMLYLYGTDDVNIPTSECVDTLSSLQADGVPVSYHVFSDEGHELGGVGLKGYSFADGYAEIIGDFAVEQTRLVNSSD
ncbi:MAG: alpha/beta fold hydrolase [Rhodothermales bacterium]|nr:alpha/beta fold hydrolase [Rhodothermales bacterium]